MFSSEREGVTPVVDAELAAVVRDALGVGKKVAMIDPPRHAKFRKVISAPFLPKALANGEARTKQLISEIFDQLPEHGEIELVAEKLGNGVRKSLDGATPAVVNGETQLRHADLNDYSWRSHCNGLYQNPIAA